VLKKRYNASTNAQAVAPSNGHITGVFGSIIAAGTIAGSGLNLEPENRHADWAFDVLKGKHGQLS
jgi:hypothetical protein